MGSAGIPEKNAFIFKWKIENFTYYVQENMASPEFFVHSIESTFYLELSFLPDQQTNERGMSFYVKLNNLLNSESLDIELGFELSFLAPDGTPLISKRKIGKKFKEGTRQGFRNLVPLEDVIMRRRSAFLPQGTLTLQCKLWKSEGDMPESAVCCARSRIGIEQSILVWPIENFSALVSDITMPRSVINASREEPLICMDFHMATASSGYQFELEFTSDKVHQIVNEEDIGCETEIFDFKLSFLNAFGGECVSQHRRRMKCHEIQKLPVLITESILDAESGYLVNDVLTLKCRFRFYKGIVFEEMERTLYGSRVILNPLKHPYPVALYHDRKNRVISSLKDINRFLYDAQLFCDVKLRVGTHFFPVHKNILIAKSPKFQSMFEKETEDVVEISNMDAVTLREMIHYIYTDTIETTKLETLFKLIEAAKHYELLTLNTKCSFILLENLDKNNACDMLIFSEKHQDPDLKLAIQNLILEHKDEIVNSDPWKLLVKNNATLAEEIHALV